MKTNIYSQTLVKHYPNIISETFYAPAIHNGGGGI